MTDTSPTSPKEGGHEPNRQPPPPPPPPPGAYGNPSAGDQGVPSGRGDGSPLRPGDEKLWATLIHIGGIFFGFVPALLGYLLLRERGAFIKENTRVALNFQLTMAIGYVIGVILSVITIGLLIGFAVWVITIIFSIMAAISTNQGRPYKYPLAIQFFNS